MTLYPDCNSAGKARNKCFCYFSFIRIDVRVQHFPGFTTSTESEFVVEFGLVGRLGSSTSGNKSIRDDVYATKPDQSGRMQRNQIDLVECSFRLSGYVSRPQFKLKLHMHIHVEGVFSFYDPLAVQKTKKKKQNFCLFIFY